MTGVPKMCIAGTEMAFILAQNEPPLADVSELGLTEEAASVECTTGKQSNQINEEDHYHQHEHRQVHVDEGGS